MKADYPFEASPVQLSGKTIGLLAGSQFEAIKTALETAGGTVVALNLAAPSSELDQVVIIHDADNTTTMRDYFLGLQGLGWTRLSHVAVFDDTAARLAQAPEFDVSQLRGFSGMIKTLQHEYPHIAFKTVSALSPFGTELADMVAKELQDAARYPEIVYDGSERSRFLPTVKGLDKASTANVQLDAGDVALVLGGAQGISPDLISEFAKTSPAHYILVGRTARDQALAEAYKSLETTADLQKHLIQVEGMRSPKEVQVKIQQINKAKSIETAIDKIQAVGATASYAQADLSDADAFAQLLADKRSSYGAIAAVFHAAAVLEDKLFKDKTVESFERVYNTKLNILPLIASLVDEAKLIVCFSSMAASFGNRGQIDYAAANSVFDMFADIAKKRGSKAKVTSIAWGPWKGAGMVSDSLEAEMNKRGLQMLTLDSGKRFFSDELRYGSAPSLMSLAGEPSAIESFIAMALSM